MCYPMLYNCKWWCWKRCFRRGWWKPFVQMRGIYCCSRLLFSISKGTMLCEFPKAWLNPLYDMKSDCIMCTTPTLRGHVGAASTVPISRTSMGLEHECRWFPRYMLEGCVGAALLLPNWDEIEVKPCCDHTFRFHALSSVPSAVHCGITNKSP